MNNHTFSYLFLLSISIVSSNLSAAANISTEASASWTVIKKSLDDQEDKNDKLCKAVESNDLKEAKRLIEHGADIQITDKHGWPLLISAIKTGNRHMVEIFINTVRIDSIFAAFSFVLAVEEGHKEIVQLYLKLGVPINSINLNGKTALMATIKYRNDCLTLKKSDLATRYDIARLLIDSGADLNIRNEDSMGNTALALAMYHDENMVDILINAGADPNIRDKKEGNTVLMKAIQAYYLDLIERLLICGSDLEITNLLGQTALDLARWHRRPEYYIKLIENEPLRRDALVKARQKAVTKLILKQTTLPDCIAKLISVDSTNDYKDIPNIAASIKARKESIVKLLESERIPNSIATLISQMAITDYKDIPKDEREF